MVAYYNDFSSIPFSVVYAFSDPEEMLASFNTLIKDCINHHAPIKRVKVTRPPCPWLKSNNIQALQVKQNKLRFEAHKMSDDSVWNAFREVCNTLKTKIKSAKRRFFQTALSSKNSKKIWKVIHSIINPSPQPLQLDPNKLNTHFTSTAQRTLGHSTNIGYSDFLAYIDSLPVNIGEKFQLKQVSQVEVFKELLNLRNFSPTGPDQIPTRYIKPVANIIAAPYIYY